MAEIIQARVWQKVDTEANWLANPLPLGSGEQAFVSDKNNFKVNTFTTRKTFTELEYFYKGDIIGGVLPTDDLANKPDGVYRATISGTYSNIVVKEGYYTLLRKEGGVWKLESEVEMPEANGVNVLDPDGNLIPNEKAVAEYISNLFFNERIDLGVLTNHVIVSVGTVTAHTGFLCTPYLNVNQGDRMKYYGKVTAVGTNLPANSYAVAGYNSSNQFVAFLLDNTINEQGEFVINNTDIIKIRACSRVGYEMSLYRDSNKIDSGLINSKSILNPIGTEIPNEKAVADYVDNKTENLIDEEFYISTVNLQPITNEHIQGSGNTASNPGFECSPFINVNLGDKYDYTGKVTTLNTNLPGTVYAVAGYTSANVFVEFLLGNDINERGTFEIINPDIAKIRASSRTNHGFNLVRRTDKISNEKVEGFEDLSDRVELLENNSGLGKYQTNLSWASIGDSITYAGCYQTLVMEKLEFTDFQNRGYAGNGFVDDVERGSILSKIQNISSYNLYTLFGGTNDFRLDKQLGIWEDYLNDTGSNTFYGALRKTIDLLYTKNPNCKIIIFTPLRRNNSDYTSFSTNLAGHKLNDYREALIKIAEHEALTILDFFMDSGITDRNLSIYTSDGLHPRTTGHTLISHRLITEIKRITA